MKVLPYLLTTVFLITFYQAHSQESRDMQAMHMIKDFYTAYSSLNYKTDRNKVDSLIDKYFTPKEGRKIKEGYKKGHDIMTNDNGINKKSLETMVIETIGDRKPINIETGKEVLIKGVKNAYEVSYVVNPLTPKDNETITEPVVGIDILVTRYNGILKISYVTNSRIKLQDQVDHEE
jgi:transposase